MRMKRKQYQQYEAKQVSVVRGVPVLVNWILGVSKVYSNKEVIREIPEVHCYRERVARPAKEWFGY
jgi:hypothetical protein